ncbi:MAG: exosortase/archaeosortase family protein [Chthoniobacteraceae bacterium]|nr:exosortase/archaeosortase family protein [Chthoniobacteraceae bacterium]
MSQPPSLLDDLWETGKWIAGIVLTLLRLLAAFGAWCGRNPVGGVMAVGIVATLFYFFGNLHPFAYGSISAAHWAWAAWNPESDQSYGVMVPFIALALFFYHREALARAPGGGYALGLAPLLFGILLFVLSFRCLNPRMALASVPFLLFGGIWFAWGRAAARVILFPCAFLVFMIPVGAIQQATANLQFIITGMVGAFSHLLGISILAVGTTLTAVDGSFNFEIAEGCSGIRSLMAMAMLTAVFVHLTQDRLWKKVLIFSGSFGFAIVGNIGRIFSIVLLAKYYDPKVAAGVYHEYSGFLFFPIAFLAMLFFSKLVNLDFHKKTGKPASQPLKESPAA